MASATENHPVCLQISLWLRLHNKLQLQMRPQLAHLPMPLQRAEFTDLHATSPAFAIGWSATDFTGDDQLGCRVTMNAHIDKVIEQDSFTSLCLMKSHRSGRCCCAARDVPGDSCPATA